MTELKTLVKKLDEIKEVWQIYEIFESEKKKFNEEFEKLKEDKEQIIETFNEISAKNAMLLAQNKELEEKNKELESLIIQKENDINNAPTQPIIKDQTINIKALEKIQNSIQTTLNSIKIELPDEIIAEQKLEISYKQYQKLLANPAKPYVKLELAQNLYDQLKVFQTMLKTLQKISESLREEISQIKNV